MNSITRTRALIIKEGRQMARDKSTLTLGIILPIFLLLLFGFGLSLDVDKVPVTVVLDDGSPKTRDLFIALNLSPYFAPKMASSMQEAKSALTSGRTSAIVRRALRESSQGGEDIQIIVNGRDSNQARIMLRYLEGAISQWFSRNHPAAFSFVQTQPRMWYNDALESRWFLIPGVTVLIMTMIGTLLTALVIAREWERGTFEALIATPVRQAEIIIGKIVPYFALGMAGLGLCLAAALFVFKIPLLGSLILVIAGSGLYLLVALCLGLLISALLKSQFLASQIVLIFSFLPTIMLSGFIFDLKSAPAFVYYVAHIFPATWYVDFMQTVFLAGNITKLILTDLAVLCVFALALLAALKASLVKSLE